MCGPTSPQMPVWMPGGFALPFANTTPIKYDALGFVLNHPLEKKEEAP